MATLSYANPNSGKLAYAIGWLNWGNIIFSAGMATRTLSYSLPGGANLIFDVNATGAGAASSSVIPTWVGAAMGNSGYTNIAGNCAITGASINLSVNINNIKLTDSYGNSIPDFAFYYTDAEATASNGGELIIFSCDTIINQVDVYPPNTPCPGYSGEGTLTVTIGNACTGTSYNSRIFRSEAPTSLSSRLYTAGGAQAMAIGFSLQQIRLKKDIAGRISPLDQFELSLSKPNLTLDTITNGSSTGVQNVLLENFGNIGDIYTINEIMSPSSASTLNKYVQSITAVNTSGGSVPTGLVLGSTIPLNAGDFLEITIKNTPNFPYIKPIKSGPSIAFQSDVLDYTVILSNTSPNPATNFTLIDTAPNGTTFIPNSIFVNGVQTSNTLPSMFIGTIPENSITTVTFKVLANVTTPKVSPILNSAISSYSYDLANSVPNLKYNSNIVSTTILDKPIINGTKIVDKSTAKFNDILTYTLAFSNSGGQAATNLYFIDTLPTGVTFINNSLSINGVTGVNLNPNPPGFSITIPSTLSTNGKITISFKVIVDTLTNPTDLLNYGSLSFNYLGGTTTYSGIVDTTTVLTTVKYIDVFITKTVDKNFSYPADTIAYSFIISTIGNIDAKNVFLIDTISNGLSIISNTLKYDGNLISGDILSGVTLPDMSKISVHTVEFLAKIL